MATTRNKLSPASLYEILKLQHIIRLPRGSEEWYTAIGFIIVMGILLMSILAPWIAPHDPTKIYVGPSLHPPSPEYPMGTDLLGMDMFSRVIWGGRILLLVALISATLSMVVGSFSGLVSGYFGGAVDRLFSIIMDSLYSFPGLILAIAITAMLGPSMMNVVIAISVIYIPTFYRMIRGLVLSIREEPFVEAAKAIGAGHITIMLKYIFPNTIPNMAVVFSLCVADAILTEAGLTFIGLGPVVPPTPDWGLDLYNGWAILISGYWWLIFFPGLFITLTVLGFALIGEGLNEMYNPLLREM